MRYWKNVLVTALVVLMMSFAVLAQTPRLTTDPRNPAPTVGTGGAVGGPTGLFTVYDGQTLRAGEYTLSFAWSNYDRDPGNVDITEIPVSFQVGVNDYIELFFNTDAYRGMKVNSPRNLSGFSLPNSQVRIGGFLTSAPAMVLAPQGAGASVFRNLPVFRPQGSQPFVPFPYTGASAGNFGLNPALVGPLFGFPAGTPPTLGPPRAGGGNGADLFPGVGSAVGGILPGLVLSTVNITNAAGAVIGTAPNISTIAPSYLPDAPFLNRTWGESAFNTFSVGAKIRFTGPRNPIGFGLIPIYRFYADRASSRAGFNQLQRGASPGAKRGDIGLIAFGDARVAKWVNISGNVGYWYNSSVKAEFANGNFTMLDRGDELTAALGVDFPVNQYFQPIGEFRVTKYVGGRTPNAFEQDPIDALLGVRIFPRRWWGISLAYRYNVNQQDRDSLEDASFRSTVTAGGQTTTTNVTGAPPGFVTSNDPHGLIIQGFISRRNERRVPEKPNTPAQIRNITISDTEIILPCPEGQQVREGGRCNESTTVTVAVDAFDAEGDQLVYQYSVSGGRVTGTGASATWDLAGVQPGTYTLSVGVDDGCGVCGTAQQTREIRVVPCPDCIAVPTPTPTETPRPCPTDLRVTASATEIDAPGTVTFTADVNLNNTNPTYTWSVNNGDITAGQGTPSITVSVPTGAANQNVTATVTLGNIDPTCPGIASATVAVRPPREAITVEEFGAVPNDRIKAINDRAALTFTQNPDSRIFVISYGPAAQVRRRNNFIVTDLTRRLNVPAGQIVVVNGGVERTLRTRILVVPAGAPEPTP